METVSLEIIHQGIQELRAEVGLLKECFHEDFLELSAKTKAAIEKSRSEINQGKFVPLEEL